MLAITSQLPSPQSELLHQVGLAIGEEKAKTAVTLAEEYNLAAHRSGQGLSEPISVF